MSDAHTMTRLHCLLQSRGLIKNNTTDLNLARKSRPEYCDAKCANWKTMCEHLIMRAGSFWKLLRRLPVKKQLQGG